MSLLPQLSLLLLAAAPQEIELISRAAAPDDGLRCFYVDASADSRFVLVWSRSSNVVPGQVDTEDSRDLFLVDRQTGVSQLVTHQGDHVTCGPNDSLDEGAISEDGSVVVFVTREEGLVAGFDSRGFAQAYRYSPGTGAVVPLTRSASDPSLGANGNTTSIDLDGAGRVAVLISGATDLVSGFVDGGPGEDGYGMVVATGTPFLITADASDPSRGAEGPGQGQVQVRDLRISNSGTQVYFGTSAVNLVAGFQPAAGGFDGSNLFRRDLLAGATTLVTRTGTSALQAASRGGRIEDLSADGERLVFTSESGDLLVGQGLPFRPQVYVYDASTGQNRMVSHLPGQPVQAAAGFGGPAKISADGRRVAYAHGADGLLLGGVDTNGRADLFVYDLAAGETTQLVTHVAGQPSVADTAAGLLDQDFFIDALGVTVTFGHTSDRLLAGFVSPAGEEMNTYRRDLGTGTLELLSRDASSALVGSNGGEQLAGLSADGATVFRSVLSGNLDTGTIGQGPVLYAAGTPGLAAGPVLRRAGTPSDSPNGATSLVVPISPLQGTSDDGRWVLLASTSSNLVAGVQRRSNGPSLYLRDVQTGATRLLNHVGDGLTTTYLSAEFGAISADGGTVVFYASGTGNLVPGFLDDGTALGLYAHDVASGATEVLSSSSVNPALPSGGTPFLRGLSSDGRFVLYETRAPDVVPGTVDTNGETDVILVDRSTGTRTLVSRAAAGGQAASGRSGNASLSPDGSLVVFQSRAADLVPGFIDVNGPFSDDVYAYDVAAGIVRLVSHSLAGVSTGGDLASFGSQVAADGTIAFQSLASDLVAGFVDRNFFDGDVFCADPSGSIRLAVSDAAQGLEGMDNGAEDFRLSGDGSSLVVLTDAGNLIPGFVDRNGTSGADLFHVDLVGGAAQLIGSLPGQPEVGGDGDIETFAVSFSGRRVAWIGDSTDLVPGQAAVGLDTNVFVADVNAASTTLVTERPASTGAEVGEIDPFRLSLSGNGACVDFVSNERDFAPGDQNAQNDVFRLSLGLQGLGASICGGVINSTGLAATLSLFGSELAAVNSLTVTVDQLPQQVFGLLVTSLEQGFVPNPGGSLGNLCINGPSIGRYSGAILSSGSMGSASLLLDLTRIPSSGQPIAALAGTTHNWQCWYRDVAAGAAVSNLSEARSLLFR